MKGLADKKEIPKETKENIEKHILLLRNPIFKLQRAADWLEGWITGSLPNYDLLNVSKEEIFRMSTQLFAVPCMFHDKWTCRLDRASLLSFLTVERFSF